MILTAHISPYFLFTQPTSLSFISLAAWLQPLRSADHRRLLELDDLASTTSCDMSISQMANLLASGLLRQALDKASGRSEETRMLSLAKPG
ncbi:unnamed protein product [Protopolystoma xenopodis]|uniref:Uncharacterized protein n=1 Tax=Protopolystoma xenopodis TaxID=117903 RepID=A0A448X724_9PLAT|nr:unnamed protein product [Protopolystoma xenopodis]